MEGMIINYRNLPHFFDSSSFSDDDENTEMINNLGHRKQVIHLVTANTTRSSNTFSINKTTKWFTVTRFLNIFSSTIIEKAHIIDCSTITSHTSRITITLCVVWDIVCLVRYFFVYWWGWNSRQLLQITKGYNW